MRKRTAGCLLAFTLAVSTCALGQQEFKREIDPSGVPVITIKGKKPAEKQPLASPIKEVEMSTPKRNRKAFKVYDLGGSDTAQSSDRPTVVVVGNPPPVYPNPGSYYNNGFGPGLYNGFGPAFYNGFVPGVQPVGSFRSVNFQTGIGFRPAFQNYYAPPINYSQPIINYRPTVPVRYTGGFFSGFRGCPGRY